MVVEVVMVAWRVEWKFQVQALSLSYSNQTPTTHRSAGVSGETIRGRRKKRGIATPFSKWRLWTFIRCEWIGWMVGRCIIDTGQYGGQRPWRDFQGRIMSHGMTTAGIGSLSRIRSRSISRIFVSMDKYSILHHSYKPKLKSILQGNPRHVKPPLV